MLLRPVAIGFLCLFLAGSSLSSAEIRIGAAANLRGTLDALVEEYNREAPNGEGISITFGSTAKLYAQIVHGAPFDLFFSADTEHAEKLERAGLSVAGSRFTYAKGRLALWQPSRAESSTSSALTEPSDPFAEATDRAAFRHLAIANPRLAPYGRAAREFLEARALWREFEPRLVYGEDVGKTFHFVQSGAAEWGFVPLSLVRQSKEPGRTWIVPIDLYSPIEQQATLLQDSVAAKAFLDFTQTAEARALFRERGYALP